MLLKQPQPIPRIVHFNCIYSKSVPKFVRTDIMYFAGFRVNQLGEVSFSGTFFYDLPAPVSIDAQKEPLSIT